MGRLLSMLAVTAAAGVLTGSAFAEPITKQNGSSPAFASFTPICAVAGYANYGECSGDTTKFSGVTGKVNAVQAKAGIYNLGISFAGLVPGQSYTLWGNLNGTFFQIGAGLADLYGHIEFGYQATLDDADLLAFDLNHNVWTTIVTSYWSGQPLSPAGAHGPLVVVPTAFVRLLSDTDPSADGSTWDFVVTDAYTITYRAYTDRPAPFDSGVLTIQNPTNVEMDEWGGAGTNMPDYATSVSCTDGGAPVASPVFGYYDSTHTRYYIWFPIEPGHSYVCTYTNAFQFTATGTIPSTLAGTTVTLPRDGQYKIDVSGTWNNDGHGWVDAEYTDDGSGGHQDGWPGLGANFGDLMVGGSFVDWGAFSPSHSYSYTGSFSGGALALTLAVFDGDSGGPVPGWYGDNSGSLSYTITYLGP